MEGDASKSFESSTPSSLDPCGMIRNSDQYSACMEDKQPTDISHMGPENDGVPFLPVTTFLDGPPTRCARTDISDTFFSDAVRPVLSDDTPLLFPGFGVVKLFRCKGRYLSSPPSDTANFEHLRERFSGRAPVGDGLSAVKVGKPKTTLLHVVLVVLVFVSRMPTKW